MFASSKCFIKLCFIRYTASVKLTVPSGDIVNWHYINKTILN